MIKDLKRYDETGETGMMESKDGEWVKYNDKLLSSVRTYQDEEEKLQKLFIEKHKDLIAALIKENKIGLYSTLSQTEDEFLTYIQELRESRP